MDPALLTLPQAIQAPAHQGLRADLLRRICPDRPDPRAAHQAAAALLAAHRAAAVRRADPPRRKAAEGQPMTIPER